jgi:hypothetical protein
MILCCGTGIGWKIYKCYRNDQRRKNVQQQQQLHYPNPILISIVDQLNEINVRLHYPGE